MRCLGLIALLCASLALAACGGDSSSAESLGPVAERPMPFPEFPAGPPPTELVVEDVELGAGPKAERGDELSIHYVAVNEEDEVRYSNWNPTRPLAFTLGSSGFFEGWDKSLEGMKAGGRRELTFPASMAGEARFYVVDLLKVEQ